MARIALIDDEYGPIDYYVHALVEAGHSVERLATVEDVLTHLDGRIPADIYVVDIMMPTHGNPRLVGAAGGLASGIVLHREIRRVFPDVPIIILTAITNPDILNGLPLETDTEIGSKIDTLPSELVAKVEETLHTRAKE